MKKTKRALRVKKRLSIPKACYFCKPTTDAVQGKEKKEPVFSEVEILRRFLTERGKIQPRARNGLCAKHQRIITRNIKYARHLALLPFVVRG